MIQTLLPIILFCGEINVHSLIQTRRSIRRFKQKEISLDTLIQLCDDTRFAPSPGNLQPWEFLIVHNKDLSNEVFQHLEWLEGAPKKDERPVSYIVILYPQEKGSWSCIACLGACCQNILLSAWVYGIGSCWIGSIKEREKLKSALKIPGELKIFSVIAVGYPAENPVVEEMKNKVIPYRDKADKLHVPKKAPGNILHINYY